MDVSVIIVNYNVRDFLKNALISLQKSLAGWTSEIFVVDNASDDGSVDQVAQHFPSVQIIRNEENLGFARANNLALARARGEFLLLINPDTLVQEDTVSSIIAFFRSHPEAGMAGCKILNPDGTLQLACRRSFPTPWTAFTKTFGLSSLFPHSPLFARYNLTYLPADEICEVDAISGSFMMIRSEVFRSIGGLDESYFMYGEDLDWCYRVKQAGWKVYYVPTTSIIHYKGESMRRSDVDELKVFYNAMRLFVKKHHTGPTAFASFIYAGIFLRQGIADLQRTLKPVSIALIDGLIVDATILFGEYIRKQGIMTFPHYAYPWIYVIPPLIAVFALFLNGVYTDRKLSVSRSFVSIVAAFVLMSSITAFVKEFAFSRIIMAISSVLSIVFIPGWRLMLRLLGYGEKYSRTTLFGRRTVIVGVDRSGQDVLKKLRARAGGGYSVIGFIDINRMRIGEKVAGIEIIGSIDTLRRIIEEHKVSEVIFSSDVVPYSTILSIIGANKNKSVNFRLVPNTLEVIIGKSNIDQLEEIPFIEIDYNITKPANRVVKRLFDLVAGTILLISVSPFVYFTHIFRSKPPGPIVAAFLAMPKVVLGSMSLVGSSTRSISIGGHKGIFKGKPGITGLSWIYETADLSAEEIEQYDLYYAKNQSFLLDLEILLKSLQKAVRQ